MAPNGSHSDAQRSAWSLPTDSREYRGSEIEWALSACESGAADGVRFQWLFATTAEVLEEPLKFGNYDAGCLA